MSEFEKKLLDRLLIVEQGLTQLHASSPISQSNEIEDRIDNLLNKLDKRKGK